MVSYLSPSPWKGEGWDGGGAPDDRTRHPRVLTPTLTLPLLQGEGICLPALLHPGYGAGVFNAIKNGEPKLPVSFNCDLTLFKVRDRTGVRLVL